MFYQITAFLLDVCASLLGGACLMRLYMQLQRVPFGNPLGRFVFAVTDWLVLPLRRVLPAMGRVDTATLLAAYIVMLMQFGLLWLLGGPVGGGAGAGLVPLLALFGLVRLALISAAFVLVVYAVMSWVRSDSPLGDVIERLCAPMLRPVRKLVPLVGGVDLSPLVLLVAIQVGLMLLAALQAAMLS